MTKRLHSDSRIQAIYNAISSKTGDTTPMTTSDMASAIDDMAGVDLMDMIADSETTAISLTDEDIKSNATLIASYLFYTKHVNPLSMSKITAVGDYAFYCARDLHSINLPNCESIGANAFYQVPRFDTNLSLNLPKCKTIGDNAFYEAYVIGELSLPECLSIGENAFRSCSHITALSLPKVTTISASAFAFAAFSFDIELPSAVTIGNQAFRHCSSTNFTIGPNCTSIGSNLFSNAGVTNLYVQATTPPTLSGAFKSGNTGVQHIYVPADSVDTYKAASVWSNYASIIEAIPAA